MDTEISTACPKRFSLYDDKVAEKDIYVAIMLAKIFIFV